jgi:hypothetical protein
MTGTMYGKKPITNRTKTVINTKGAKKAPTGRSGLSPNNLVIFLEKFLQKNIIEPKGDIMTKK